MNKPLPDLSSWDGGSLSALPDTATSSSPSIQVLRATSPDVLLRHVLTQVRCLLWVAEVQEQLIVPNMGWEPFVFDARKNTYLQWNLNILEPESVLKWLPLHIEKGQNLDVAFREARDREEVLHCDRNANEAIYQGLPGYTQEFRCFLADGTVLWLLEDVQIEQLRPGEWQLVGICLDITQRKEIERKLEYQATHDTLTGLPNRVLLHQRMAAAVTNAQKEGRRVGLLFLDLDNFKLINDSLGHQAGDLVLVAVANRLRRCIRNSDFVARLGGDEFTILMADVPDPEIALMIADRVVQSLKAPFPLYGQPVFTSPSIGIAFSTDMPGINADTLLRNADAAMYHAKAGGKSRVERFVSDMNARAVEQLEIGSELHRAIKENELELHYQPILDLETGFIREVEALVRWAHPLRGLLPPDRFISIAEGTGSIGALGLWVLREACRQMQEWRKQSPEQLHDLVLSVNLSVRQLQDTQFVNDVRKILEETGLDPRLLKLEVTETAMMQDAITNRQTLRALRELGIKIAMDDFGVGYSSMAYLDYLPVDTIKIDRTFIQRLGTGSPDEENDAIVRAIIAMAKAMGIQVTSEGIEGPEQVTLLRALACDRGQGNYFARPLTKDNVLSFLAKDTDSRLLAETTADHKATPYG